MAPNRALTSRVRPEPNSPNMPRISPRRSVKLTGLGAPSATKSRASKSVSPMGTWRFGYISFSSRPTIILIRSSRRVSAVLHVSIHLPSRSTVTRSLSRKISSSLCEI